MADEITGDEPTVAADVDGARGPSVGVLVAERFELLERLGQGGMGAVFRAVDRVLGRDVAVKVLRGEIERDEGFVARFFHEARIVASLTGNPHVVSIFDLGRTHDGLPYLVMEHLTGNTLQAMLDSWRPPSRTFVIEVGAQIAAALVGAHAHGVVHRDLKPANVFVMESPTYGNLTKVLDFGIARSATAPLPAEHATVPGEVFGTPRYLAPEVIGGGTAEPPADIYALGLMLFELTCGHYPYSATTLVEYLRAHILDTPPPLDSSLPPDAFPYPGAYGGLVEAMLSKRPDARPSAREIVGALFSIDEEIEAWKHHRAESDHCAP